MGDTKKSGIDTLPGNHGQFGADIETENYETLPDLDVADGDVAGPGASGPGASGPGAKGPGVPGGGGTLPAPDDSDAAKTPGQHQEQGGMRS